MSEASKEASVPDVLIHWTTAAALIAFGIIFLNDTVVMGKTILALGLLNASNEGLKWYSRRQAPKGFHHQLRMLVAVAYVTLIVIGFLFPPQVS